MIPAGWHLLINKLLSLKDGGWVRKSRIPILWKHIAASAGAEIMNDPYFNLARVGLDFMDIAHSEHILTKEAAAATSHARTDTPKSYCAYESYLSGDMVSYGGYIPQNKTKK